MTTLEIVMLFLFSGSSPFGVQDFIASHDNTCLPSHDCVTVEFYTKGVTLQFDRDLNFEVIEGEVVTCQQVGLCSRRKRI